MGIAFPALADLAEAEKAEKAARDSLVDHFIRFTQSKNVMGLPQDPDGKPQKAGSKTRFNADDGLSFKSDLTYHDFSFNTTETEKNDKGQETSKRLFAFISPHGKISGAGGSSILERTAFQLDQRFEKEDRDEKNQKKIEEAEKQGISFRSIFKIETQEIIDDKGGGQNGQGQGGQAAQGAKKAQDEAKNAKAEKIKVERIFMRDEARPEIEKVGEDSFEDIRQNARDKGFEGDEKTLANGVLLRFAAGAATQALYNSTLANLAQRRANRGLRAGKFPDTPQLSESTPTCDNWAATANSVLGSVKNDKEREELQKEIERMNKQCQQLAKTPYNAINPRFQQDEKGENEQLKEDGPNKEDGFQRDMRVQLEILNKAGKSVKSVPSNWKYKDQDEKARVTIDYNENAPKEATLTVKEQLDTYNNQLKEAAKGFDETNSRLPKDLQTNSNAPNQYQIQSESRTVMDINFGSQPTQDELSEKGIAKPATAKNYDELLKQPR